MSSLRCSWCEWVGNVDDGVDVCPDCFESKYLEDQ